LIYIESSPASNSARVLFVVDRRSVFGSAIDNVSKTAIDPYVFVREAYLQHREFLVRDGKPSERQVEQGFDDLLDDLEDP